MKLNSMLAPVYPSAGAAGCPAATTRSTPGLALVACFSTVVAIAAIPAHPALAEPTPASSQIAQALPTPLPPLPNTSAAPSGEQFLVLVNGSSDLLLQQVRQIEPGAFINYVNGQSVIQAGRFSDYANAQTRADELAYLGIGAQVQATNAVGAPIAVTTPANYSLSYPTPVAAPPAASVAQLPPSSVAVAPTSVEFGQAAPFPNGAAATLPPPTASPYAVPPASLTTTAALNESNLSGYFVVVPASTGDLSNLASRIIGLGAPSSLVRTRTSPRGPHVAIGPYSDRGIAQEWTNYLRDAGISRARVHFE